MSVERQEIVTAISLRSVVEMRYESQASRVVHPHVLYRGAEGQELLDTYQVAGFTHKGRLPAWRLFSVSKITEFRMLEAVFEIAPGYNPDSPKYRGALIVRVH
ncbi:MAG TPA: hypothetical protein VGO39_11280 [Gaiellaceae bacterium]|jgi:hypothetical protein|nr:hypothetical protein [Gaiellaceae bacterium]